MTTDERGPITLAREGMVAEWESRSRIQRLFYPLWLVGTGFKDGIHHRVAVGDRLGSAVARGRR